MRDETIDPAYYTLADGAAALRSIVRRRHWRELSGFLDQDRADVGIETPTRADLGPSTGAF